MKACKIAIMGFEKYEAHLELATDVMKSIRSFKTKKTIGFKPFIFMVQIASKNELKKFILENKIHTEYDLIVSLGGDMSQTLKKVYKEIGEKPTMFIGVTDPVGIGIVKSVEHPGGCFTGVNMAAPCYEKYASAIKDLVPYISKILIPYNPTALNGIAKQRTVELVKQLTAVGFEILPVEAKNNKDTLKAIEKHIGSVHAIQSMNGSPAGSASSAAYVCALTGRVLFSHDGYSGILKGAAISYGCRSEVLPDALAHMIYTYWNNSTPIHSIPVVTIPNQRIVFVNVFMLPLLPKNILSTLLKNKDIEVCFYWANCPVKQELRKIKPIGREIT